MQVVRRIAAASIRRRRTLALIGGYACLVGISFSNAELSDSPVSVEPFAAEPPASMPGTIVAAPSLANDALAPGTERRQAAIGNDVADGGPPPRSSRRARGLNIGGTIEGVLTPGGSAPINVSITNRSASVQMLTELEVRISEVSAPRADATHPCSVRGFAGARSTGPARRPVWTASRFPPSSACAAVDRSRPSSLRAGIGRPTTGLLRR